MNKLFSTQIAALFISFTAVASVASAQTIRANDFSCEGGSYVVNYSSTSRLGQPVFTVTNDAGPIALGASETLRTVLGNQTTAEQQDLPSDVWIHYTLILPDVQLAPNSLQADHAAMLVRTVVSGPTPPWVTEVSPANTYVALQCKATFVQN